MEWIMYLVVGCVASVVAALTMLIVVFSIAWLVKRTPRGIGKICAILLRILQIVSACFVFMVVGYAIVTQFSQEVKIDGMVNGYHSKNYVISICDIDDIHSNKDT